MKQKLPNLSTRFNKQTFLFVAGLLGVAHETLLEHSERPTLIILFAAMMGLPAFLSPGQSNHSVTSEIIGDTVRTDEAHLQEREVMKQITEFSQEHEKH
jgi:hypothetical protein